MPSPPNSRKTRRYPARPQALTSEGQVRIIAGRWRGRKLTVPAVQGLRPTGNRVRETLFNWLQADINGAHCLDLFAGSGALGFEALSRYAQSVTFVESDANAHRNLIDSCQLLEVSIADSPAINSNNSASSLPIDDDSRQSSSGFSARPDGAAHLYLGSAQSALDLWTNMANSPAFDIIFIDPPFQMDCQWRILQHLVAKLAARNGLIYVESPALQVMPEQLPPACDLIREKRFGDVMARLIKYAGPT